jgi:dihydrofolate synthase / folylpolyglutamate synthase
LSTEPPAEQGFRQVEAALLARWPESRLDPSLDRIRALVDVLGSPQQAYPVIHLTGTNGKTTTARMIDELLRGFGLRVGRLTSPHLASMTERISVDGRPLTPERFVEVYADLAPYLAMVDSRQPVPLSFFEVITAMGYAAFAETPVDIAVVEVGMGGSWDATSVADGAVAVVTPVAVDHARYLGDTLAEIAAEKAGVIKAGAFAILAQQPVDAAQALLRRAAEVQATVAREGIEFGVRHRSVAVGGQMMALTGLGGTYEDVFLPLHGAHQAHNAVCALAAVEAFFGAGQGPGRQMLDTEVVRGAFARVSSPGRLEVVRRSPTVLLDAAHNPAGARATAEAIGEAFAFTRLVGVVAVAADKDVRGLLEAFEPVFAEIVVTQNSSPRSLGADELAKVAVEVFGPDRVEVTPRLDDALDVAVRLAEEEGDLGGAGVLVTGSIVTVGEARLLLGAGRKEG